jgi:hypothetical protein
MNLNLNGISARLYRWFYATNEMPQTLCPYFWKLVIAYILFIPWAIITLPTRVINNDIDTGSERLFVSVLLWVMILATICMIFSVTAFWVMYSEKTILGAMQRAGLFTFCLVTLVSMTFGAVGLTKYIQDRKRQKHREYIYDDMGNYIHNPIYVEPRPNLVKEFIKAKYNKYCPKIDWK